MSCNKFWVTRRETSTHSFEVFPYLSNAIVFYKLHSRSFQSFLHLVSRFKRYIGCLDGPLPTEHWGYWHQKRSRVNIWSPKISSYYYHKTNFKWKHHSRQQKNARQKIQTHYNWWYSLMNGLKSQRRCKINKNALVAHGNETCQHVICAK